MRKGGRRALVDVTGARLGVDELVHFARPLTWREILAIEPKRPARWWEEAIMRADDTPGPNGGDGLIEWDKDARAWRLSEAGAGMLLFGAYEAAE